MSRTRCTRQLCRSEIHRIGFVYPAVVIVGCAIFARTMEFPCRFWIRKVEEYSETVGGQVVFDPVKHVGEKKAKRGGVKYTFKRGRIYVSATNLQGPPALRRNSKNHRASNNRSRAIQACKKGMTKINETLKVRFPFIK